MKRALSLRWRLVLTYLILIVITMSLFVLWVGFALQKARVEQWEHGLEVEALFIASTLEEQVEQHQVGQLNVPHLQELVAALGHDAKGRLTVMDDQGRPLADSEGGLPAPSPPDAPEIAAALTGRERLDIRPDETGQETLYAAAPIRHEDLLLGVARLEVPTTGLQAEICRQWLWLAGAGLLVVLAATAVSLWLAGGILRPVRTLTGVARQIADGALDRRIAADAEDELGEMGRAFNQMADRVAEMFAQQRMFVANASHELRTPLTSIRLWTEALLDGAKNDPEQEIHFLREIEAQTDRLSSLVEKLLNLSRLESGLISVEMIPTALPEFIGDVAAEFQPQVEQKEITLHLDVSPSLPLVSLDRGQIRQVLLNLLDNALRYTPSGGQIGISVVASTSPSSMQVSITDSGPGIPEKDLPHVFERFYRGDEARSSATGGSGLGLAIVKSIVEAHGGRVWAESRERHGATISFTLPLKPKAVSHFQI